ncbi:MAG: hypothetical protein LIO93_09250 [Bacteroidales bacterium]|nr:hypothetical protein [Bacteroidales bacterium]
MSESFIGFSGTLWKLIKEARLIQQVTYIVKCNMGYVIKYLLLLPAAGIRNNNGNLNNVGTNGNYWSSTVSSTNAYNLNFNSTNINPANNNNRSNGMSVRCVSELNVNLFIYLPCLWTKKNC